MALQQTFTFTRSSDGHTLILTDTTGAYSTDNPGGYGGPNPDVSDFTALSIAVYLPDETYLTPQQTAIDVDIYPTLPSATDGAFDLTSTVLVGSDSVLIDGWYQGIITGTYDTGGGETAITPVTVNTIFYQIAECCIQKLMLATDVTDCCEECNDKKTRLAFCFALLYMLSPHLDSAGQPQVSYIESCTAWDKGVEYLQYLKEVCAQENCGGGCGGCQ